MRGFHDFRSLCHTRLARPAAHGGSDHRAVGSGIFLVVAGPEPGDRFAIGQQLRRIDAIH